MKIEKLAENLNEAIRSLSEGSSQPVVKYDVVLNDFNPDRHQEIIACLARHNVVVAELKSQSILSSEMGLIDATILTDMLTNIPGTLVSFNEHSNKDGNLILVDLIQESAALSNSLLELLNSDSASVIAKLQSRQQLSFEVIKQRIQNLTTANQQT